MTPTPPDDPATAPTAPGGPSTPPAHPPASLFGHTLPEGTRLHEFEITGLVGEGGFGIVYLAWDPTLERRVAIKEYMPAALASRATGTMTVSPRSARHAETFRAGLKSFVNEARLLARFDHPSLLKVYRFWEANGTAYMVMPYYEGPTLRAALSALQAPPSEAELRRWIDPLLDAMAVLHAEQCFHRDIAPDNILLTDTGPLLLDFGAARRVVGDMTHALTVMLKPGFAPIEQYGDSPTMGQGAWTDLYALACVVYYAITGNTPTSSIERLMGDRLPPLGEVATGLYSDDFLRAIDATLSVQPNERPQDVAQFRALMGGAAAVAAAHAPSPAAVHEEDAAPPPRTVPPDLMLPTQGPVPADEAPVQRQPVDVQPPPGDGASVPASAHGPIPATTVLPRAAPSPSPSPSPSPAPASPARPPGPIETRPGDVTWMPLTDFAPDGEAPAATPRRVGRRIVAAVAVGAIALAGWWIVGRDPAPVASPPARAASAPPAAAAPPASAAPEPTSAPLSPATPASASAPSPAPTRAASSSSARRLPAPSRAADTPADSPARERTAEPPAAAAPPPRAATPARCFELIQKASLESLTDEETRYLKKDCQ